VRLTVFLLVAIAAIPIFSQTSDHVVRKFEVASLKSNQTGSQEVSLNLRPGPRFAATNIPFRLLLRLAFRPLQDSLILGIPAWINSDRFDVDARAEEPLSSDELGPALLSLLEERCQLRTHRESRELPVYLLSVAKGGPKMKNDDPPSTYGGNTFGSVGNLPLYARPISQLVTFLSPQLDRPVVDKTNLKGYYDIELRFTPPYQDGAATPSTRDSTTVTVFTAVQEQLGLKLEAGKAAVEVVVIDSVQKPTD
jgi:uncharacterized protein (TIGR03435 family)